MERWSCVGKKANKPWSWIAMDAQTRQGIVVHLDDRRRTSAQQLWANIPAMSQQYATLYPDRYEVYKGVMPPAQHKAITKQARNTRHLKRFNHTLHQRGSRLVREAWSFPRNSPTISARSHTSSATTASRELQHYMDSTDPGKGLTSDGMPSYRPHAPPPRAGRKWISLSSRTCSSSPSWVVSPSMTTAIPGMTTSSSSS
jgi:IS1 family transposase